jgi:hypothetical protein
VVNVLKLFIFVTDAGDNKPKVGATTLSITTLNIMTLSVKGLYVTLSIKGLHVTLIISDKQHNNTLPLF